jgi:hypothetical protein
MMPSPLKAGLMLAEGTGGVLTGGRLPVAKSKGFRPGAPVFGKGKAVLDFKGIPGEGCPRIATAAPYIANSLSSA